MSELNAKEYKRFEEIKHIRSDGGEYWLARELSSELDYIQWRNFSKVLDKAKLACKNSGFDIDGHFAEVSKMVEIGSGTNRRVIDFELSRYACYLAIPNAGYKGLYGGLDVEELHRRKGLSENDKILDFMGSEELAANLFRITQTESKLKRENIHGMQAATVTHYTVGRKVRQTIRDLGGTMPEDLPTPEKSISQVEREQITALKRKAKKKPLMLDE